MPARAIDGKRVLLVEDEMLIALDTQDELQKAGCHVVGPVARLDAALATARTAEIDAAVLDVNLGGEYVWPVAEALIRRGIPFVLLTGFGTTLDVPASCSSAPRLDKPIKPGALQHALGRLAASGPGTQAS